MSFPVDDIERWMELGKLDANLDQILRIRPAAFKKSTDIATIAATREDWKPLYKAGADKALEEVDGRVEQDEIYIPRRDGGTSRALVYKPSGPTTTPRPLLVMIHGGGFCFGSPEMEGRTCIQAVNAYGCVALSLSYRLAPENKFPAASDDCWDTLVWIASNASKLGADPTKGFVLGGTSAGGNIAIVLSHLARETGLSPQLTGVYLNVPLVLAPEAVAPQDLHLYRSREQNALAPVLNKAFMDMYTEAYAADVGSHIWSPYNWPGPEPHKGLPPTYFQICGLDVLRDEGLMYERVLRTEYGIRTKVDVYPGLPHMFVPNFPEHPSSRKYPVDALKGLGWLFNA
ncbi:hypothetical protein FALCPG4_008659 [Fusarium falciforme]